MMLGTLALNGWAITLVRQNGGWIGDHTNWSLLHCTKYTTVPNVTSVHPLMPSVPTSYDLVYGINVPGSQTSIYQ